MLAFSWKDGSEPMSTVHLHSSTVSPLRSYRQICDRSSTLSSDARTSSVYRMILSASDVYIVATNTRSVRINVSLDRRTEAALVAYRVVSASIYFRNGHSLCLYTTCSHSPELGLDLLARRPNQPQKNQLEKETHEPFAQNGALRHQILQPTTERRFSRRRIGRMNKSLPVLANGNSRVILRDIGGTLHEIFRFRR
jgi:hypothetical protein